MTDASPTTTDAEFWHVQLPSGEVRYWSLTELDEAFQRDEISAATYVLKEGETTWMRLGELLGLDEVPEKVAVPIAPYSIAPLPPSVYPGDVAAVNSIRPVVADLDGTDLGDDDLVAAMKPKKKNMAVVGGGVAAALLLAVVGLTRASGGSEVPVAAAAAPPPPAVVSTVADTAAAAAPSTLSDDVKRQLLEADKAREAKAAEKAAERAAEAAKYQSTRPGRAPKSGNVFHKGGNKYDPLNAGN